MRIGNRNQAFDRNHSQWPWMTPSPDFKFTLLFDIVCLRNGKSEIEIQLQWNTNRDLYTPYSRVSFRMTLSDLQWLSEIFSDMKHRAASLRQLSFLLSISERTLNISYRNRIVSTNHRCTVSLRRGGGENSTLRRLAVFSIQPPGTLWHWQPPFIRWSSVDPASAEGRRHSFESGGGQFCERSEPKKILTPHFLASGGQNIA